MLKLLKMSACALALATAAEARDAALIIGNDDYARLRDLSGGGAVIKAVKPLRDAGFDVTSRASGSAAEMAEALRLFLSTLNADTDRAVVALSGRFVHSATDSFLLGADADRAQSLGSVSAQSLPVSLVLAALADYPGAAVLLLGADEPGGGSGGMLREGLGEIIAPQGVTVLRGTPKEAGRFAARSLGARGRDLMADAGNLSVSGYAPRQMIFLAEAGAAPSARPRAPEPNPPYEENGVLKRDNSLWKQAKEADSLRGYRDYLAVFPKGMHVEEARARIKAIEAEPFRAEKAAEKAQNLSREQRRQIQRSLKLLGHDPRGIDGIFGRGSRAAVKSWQGAQGYAASSYLSADQVALLNRQAEVRAKELEEEARQKRIAREKEDRDFWQRTGASGKLDDARVYLKRYPDGLYAEQAEEVVKADARARQEAASQRDREAWGIARDMGSAAAFDAYLRNYPKGAFAEEARKRIAELRGQDNAADRARKQAKAREDALGMSNITRSLVEQRLAALGLEPGPVDGVFDRQTRRALRRYQDGRGLKVTGYLDQDTIVRLLADAVLR